MLSPVPRHAGFWPAFLLLLSVLAGCRSEKVAFTFQPGPATAHSAARPADSTQAAAVLPLAKPNALAATAPPRRLTPKAARPQRPAVSRKQAQRLSSTVLRPMLKQQARSQAATHAAPADQGLGKVFWFAVLAVVVVLALLTWGVAALFGLGFWQALGWLGLGVLALLLIKGAIELLK